MCPSASVSLRVSVSREARMAPASVLSARTAAMQRSIASTSTSGRAPSWMATSSKSGGMATSPENTESWRVTPARVSVTSQRSASPASTSRLTSSRRPCGQTTTRCPTEGARSKAKMDHAMMGRPHSSTNCLPRGSPKRSPDPPATMMAQVSGPSSADPRRSLWAQAQAERSLMPACPTCDRGCRPGWSDCPRPGRPGGRGSARCRP